MWIEHTVSELTTEIDMTTAITKQTTALAQISDDTLSKLVLNGDLSQLSAPQRVEYYKLYCGRLGLDPATQPFKILKLQGRETLYADRGCAQQLNNSRGISHKILARENINGVFMVTARAETADGRYTESIGAVTIEGLKGEALCNAFMKAETKAKRRSTLDLVGLGITDESEIHSIPSVRTATINLDDGSVVDEPAPAPQPKPQPRPAPAVAKPDPDWTQDTVPMGEESLPPSSSEPSGPTQDQLNRAGLEAEAMTQEELEQVVIPFGKNKGLALGDVSKGVRWSMAEKWEVKPFRGEFQHKDLLLQAQARRLRELLGEQ